MFLKPGTSDQCCMQKKATMMSENAENICSSLKGELQARCCRLLAKVDFSECEFWISRNVNSNFQFFSRTKLTTFSLSLSLWKIASPLQLPGGIGGEEGGEGGQEGSPRGRKAWGVTDTEVTYWAQADKYEYVTGIQMCLQCSKLSE